jgi:hypothetical protein
MERCPNCGQLSRLGARFCTTCGQKLATDNAETVATPKEVVIEASETATSDATEDNTPNGGWPAAPAVGESATEVPGATPPSITTNTEEATGDEVKSEEAANFWSSGSTASWPSPPEAGTEEPPSDSVDVETEAVVQEEEESVSVPSAADSDAAAARERAIHLLDELRETIAALSGEEPRDLSGVISELEVAVTPPGAIDAEELNELREALMRARERPRDIDSIVDLTGRLDAMVALIFAYDRTVAAIERSLDVLRGDG